jgi:Acetoacetate decarboxylase (ADC)
MSLQGWSLPLSPAGTAALVPPPPWHFSGEALGVDFITDPAAVAAVLPAGGIEPSGDGSASFVFGEWSSNAEQDPRLAADPARGQYREAYVMVYGRLDGRDIAWLPYIWVDNDLSIARGLIQGSPKKAGSIAISRAASIGRGGPRLEAGATFAGHASSLGRRLASGSVTLDGPAEGYCPRALCLPVWHTRLLAAEAPAPALRPLAAPDHQTSPSAEARPFRAGSSQMRYPVTAGRLGEGEPDVVLGEDPGR